MPKTKRLEAFGDKNGRCLISSIAGYETAGNNDINIHLKSGETVTLQFNKTYLQKKAMEHLDRHFTIEMPETNPCNVCSSKDKPIAKPSEYEKTRCDRCFAGKPHFSEPKE